MPGRWCCSPQTQRTELVYLARVPVPRSFAAAATALPPVLASHGCKAGATREPAPAHLECRGQGLPTCAARCKLPGICTQNCTSSFRNPLLRRGVCHVRQHVSPAAAAPPQGAAVTVTAPTEVRAEPAHPPSQQQHQDQQLHSPQPHPQHVLRDIPGRFLVRSVAEQFGELRRKVRLRGWGAPGGYG